MISGEVDFSDVAVLAGTGRSRVFYCKMVVKNFNWIFVPEIL